MPEAVRPGKFWKWLAELGMYRLTYVLGLPDPKPNRRSVGIWSI
jgi:hypothetical protein